VHFEYGATSHCELMNAAVHQLLFVQTTNEHVVLQRLCDALQVHFGTSNCTVRALFTGRNTVKHFFLPTPAVS